MACSAAPECISRDVEARVLGPDGFETAVNGKNGFVRTVAYSWTCAPDADFWNPKVRVAALSALDRKRTFHLTGVRESGHFGSQTVGHRFHIAY